MPSFERHQPADGADERAALDFVIEAFAEGCLDGHDAGRLAEAALFTAFQELVATYGEEGAARYAAALPDRIREGAFTTGLRH